MMAKVPKPKLVFVGKEGEDVMQVMVDIVFERKTYSGYLPVVRAKWIECPEEHNGYDDHCMTCMPYWMEIPTCPYCQSRLAENGYCKACKKYYEMRKGDE